MDISIHSSFLPHDDADAAMLQRLGLRPMTAEEPMRMEAAE